MYTHWERTAGTLMVLSTLYLNVHGHVAAWHKGMYCLNGTVPGIDNHNTNQIVNPMYQLSFKDWWMHHIDKCDEFPPDEGDFLEIPAMGVFTVELAVNRAFTTLSFDGRNIGTYPNGHDDSDLGDSGECISEPNIHTTSESAAAGTAFAISYTSNLIEVKPDNLAVFSVLYNTPWRRLATYTVPRLPPCPEGGCICAWGWVPNGCGQPNMYMQPFRCNVTGRTGDRPLANANAPVWCEGNKSNCIQGAKQMIFWNQKEGNNIVVSGQDRYGSPKSPGYNMNLGFVNGPQNDIFQDGNNNTTVSSPPGENSAKPLISMELAYREPYLLAAVFLVVISTSIM